VRLTVVATTVLMAAHVTSKMVIAAAMALVKTFATVKTAIAKLTQNEADLRTNKRSCA
jgi:hypothetical protein